MKINGKGKGKGRSKRKVKLRWNERVDEIEKMEMKLKMFSMAQNLQTLKEKLIFNADKLWMALIKKYIFKSYVFTVHAYNFLLKLSCSFCYYEGKDACCGLQIFTSIWSKSLPGVATRTFIPFLNLQKNRKQNSTDHPLHFVFFF